MSSIGNDSRAKFPKIWEAWLTFSFLLSLQPAWAAYDASMLPSPYLPLFLGLLALFLLFSLSFLWTPNFQVCDPFTYSVTFWPNFPHVSALFSSTFGTVLAVYCTTVRVLAGPGDSPSLWGTSQGPLWLFDYTYFLLLCQSLVFCFIFAFLCYHTSQLLLQMSKLAPAFARLLLLWCISEARLRLLEHWDRVTER